MQTAIQELGKVDILHANAGILPRVTFTEVTDTLWSDCINTNLTGYGNFARAMVSHLIERGEGGRIIFTASTHGAQGSNERHVYTAAKWGVIGLAKSLALELSQHSILVNCVAPGFTNTGMANNDEMYGILTENYNKPNREQAIKAALEMNQSQNHLPIPWVEPEDIAAAVVFLASNNSRYITGTTIDVAGGLNAHYTS